MFFKNKNEMRIGKVVKELRLCKKFGLVKWRWKRSFFKHMGLCVVGAMNPHIMITGESGSGKSNTCKLILRELASAGANFVVVDPHSEYVENAKEFGASAYDAGINGMNIFDLDGLSERERTAEISGTFRRIFHLGEVQANTLHNCIAYTYWVCFRKGKTPSMHNLIYTIKVFKRHANRTEMSTLNSLEKRLSAMAGYGSSGSVDVRRMMQSRSIFSLASLHTAEAQSVYMESMLRKIYTNMLSMRNENRGVFYVVIDEAEKLQESPVVARLVAEGRKHGVGIIAISQRAKALDKEIRSNAATIIAFAQREPEEQSYVANLISCGNDYNRFVEVRKALRELSRGQALVLEARAKNPKIVKCLRFEAKTRDPSYRIIRLAERSASLQELVGKLQSEGFVKEEVLGALDLLEKKNVLEHYFVKEAEYRGTWYITMPKNSAEHEIMVNLISRHLTRMGIRNVVYNKAYGPDVVAFIDGKIIAVEYETGKKDAESTRKMLEYRKNAYSEVIVIGHDSV